MFILLCIHSFTTVIDHCVSAPCLNQGKCTNLRNDFSCECELGYRGKRCQEEKNECVDKPCYGNAACIDKVSFTIGKLFAVSLSAVNCGVFTVLFV